MYKNINWWTLTGILSEVHTCNIAGLISNWQIKVEIFLCHVLQRQTSVSIFCLCVCVFMTNVLWKIIWKQPHITTCLQLITSEQWTNMTFYSNWPSIAIEWDTHAHMDGCGCSFSLARRIWDPFRKREEESEHSVRNCDKKAHCSFDI